MGLMADIGHGPVGVDTSIFIYFIEEHPKFLSVLQPFFRDVDKGRKELVTSAVTLLEVLVVPYRSGDHLLAERLFFGAAKRTSEPDGRLSVVELTR